MLGGYRKYEHTLKWLYKVVLNVHNYVWFTKILKNWVWYTTMVLNPPKKYLIKFDNLYKHLFFTGFFHETRRFFEAFEIN